MHHMAVALDEERIGDLDRADLRHAADIVAAKIKQHEMFGALFRIGHEFSRQRLVLGRAFSPRPCAGDRADDHPAVAHAHQDFGTGANNLEAAEVEETEIGRRIDPP